MKVIKHKIVMKKMISVMLLAALVIGVTGCGGEKAPEEPQATEEPDAVHEDAVKVENGTISADSVVIAIGQTAVPYSEYKSYYYFMESQYDSLLTEQVWKQSSGGDKTIGQEAIEDVLRMIIQVKVTIKEAARQGVALEPAEKEDADYNAQKFYESLDDATIRDNMITSAQLTQMFEENALAEKMYRVVTGQAGVSESTDYKAYRVQLIYKKSGDDKAAIKAKMDELQSTIASSNKNFYYHAKKESELSEIESIVGSLDTRKNLWQILATLKVGVVSPVIEESDGFYIAIVLEKPNDELNTEYRNQVVSDSQIEFFQKSYEQWSDSYEVVVSESLLSD